MLEILQPPHILSKVDFVFVVGFINKSIAPKVIWQISLFQFWHPKEELERIIWGNFYWILVCSLKDRIMSLSIPTSNFPEYPTEMYARVRSWISFNANSFKLSRKFKKLSLLALHSFCRVVLISNQLYISKIQNDG